MKKKEEYYLGDLNFTQNFERVTKKQVVKYLTGNFWKIIRSKTIQQ